MSCATMNPQTSRTRHIASAILQTPSFNLLCMKSSLTTVYGCPAHCSPLAGQQRAKLLPEFHSRQPGRRLAKVLNFQLVILGELDFASAVQETLAFPFFIYIQN